MKHHLKAIRSHARFVIASAFTFAGAALFSIALSTTAAGGKGGGGGGTTTTGPNASADVFTSGATVDVTSVIVQLKGDPLSTNSSTKPPPGKKIDFNSATVKSYRAILSGYRNDFKKWLKTNAPAAKVTGEYDISLNAVAVQLNGTSITTVQQYGNVSTVEYEGLYYQADVNDPDLNLIKAIDAWNAGGGTDMAKGAGVKIAVIDTGIDITHPCFSDAGYAPQPQLGDHNYTNNKVIAAKVFNNKAGSRGYTAAPAQEHGSHVAGSAACNQDTDVNVDGVAVPYDMSGVAPKALLGNYNVFPGDVTNARSEDILNALEAAYADGFDIANMSLGGGAHGIQDLLTKAIDDLDQAGFISAVAAGNSGPNPNTVESPGSAARALTAGAVTVGHYIGVNVTDDTNAANFAAATGDFGPNADATGPLSADQGILCSPGGSLTGQIALIERGTCSFSTKIRNAQNAGAVGAVMVNNVFGPPIAMASDGTPNQPTIPGVMVSKSELGNLSSRTGDTFTIHSAKSYVYNAADNDYLAGFSSRGPTDVDFRVKPDVTAPGVNVLSSIPAAFCANPPCFAFFQGTSMATPHLAGSAAVVKAQHPTWSSAQIRSAVVNTSDATAVKDSSTGLPTTNANDVGSGRENLLSAVNAKAALDPVSVSFGSVPSISGIDKTFTVTVSNVSSSAATFSFSVSRSRGTGVSYSVSPSSLVLAAGGSGTVTVSMSSAQGSSLGAHQATLSVTNGSEVAHAIVFTTIQ
ncbi:MAG: S8 family serine peptidase [Chthoniobacterales bacterium]